MSYSEQTADTILKRYEDNIDWLIKVENRLLQISLNYSNWKSNESSRMKNIIDNKDVKKRYDLGVTSYLSFLPKYSDTLPPASKTDLGSRAKDAGVDFKFIISELATLKKDLLAFGAAKAEPVKNNKEHYIWKYTEQQQKSEIWDVFASFEKKREQIIDLIDIEEAKLLDPKDIDKKTKEIEDRRKQREEQYKTSQENLEQQEQERQKKLQITGNIRINEQAALLLSAAKFINKPPQTDNKVKPADRYKYTERTKRKFSNFATYRNGTQGRGGHIDFSKNVFKSSELQYFLKDIPPHIISSLTPAIKIFKVFYPDKNLFTPNGDGISWRIPFDEIPVPYYVKPEYNNSSLGVANIKKTSDLLPDTQEAALEEILKGESRFRGAGIKSFRYKYVGTNPAEVNTNIEADLEIQLQDVRDIVREFTINPNDSNFSLKENKPNSSLKFSYCDLVADAPAFKKEVYNTDYYRIKVMIGYSIPPLDYLANLAGGMDEAIKIKKSLEKATVFLYLNPYSHDITFEENGSITLKIQYTAAMTTQTTAMNCLEVAYDAYKNFKESQKKFDDVNKQINENVKQIRQNCRGLTSQELNAQIKKKYKDAENELETQKSIIEFDKNKIYSEIFSRITGAKQFSNGVLGTVYETMLDAGLLGLTEAGEFDKNSKPYEFLDKQKFEYKVSSITQQDPQWFLTQEVRPDIKRSADPSSPQPEEKTSEVAANALSKKAEENIRTSLTPMGGENKGKFSVKFVFLGDVFDVFCDIVNTDQIRPQEKPRIILTDFELEVPSTTDKSGNIEYEKCTFNIADIPITLEMLKYFLMEKIVKPRRSIYNLFQLLTNIMTDIVSSALAPKYFGTKSILNRSIRLSMLGASIPRAHNDKDPISGENVNNPFNTILTGDSLRNKNISDSISIDNHNNICNYVVIYCSNQLPNLIKINNGDVKKDEESGVYHFYIGSDRGIIKKINFSKTNSPFYKEGKNQSSQGASSLGRLQEVYDITVNMFGNNIYIPGDFIYIEPLFFAGIDNKAAVNLQTKIGLGGYYLIIDVETKASVGNYDTTLHAVLYARIQENGEILPEASENACSN